MLVVDLFCGCGGFSIGASKAGHTVVLAIDNWDTALHVHAHNQPNANHLCMELGGDLQEMKTLIMKNIIPGSKWHLHGSPPCQNMSNANRTSGDKTEGMRLVYWYLDLVKLCKPTSWSMEQVINVRHFLDETDYDQFELINTVNFGIPQTRKRLFIGSGWHLPNTHKHKALVDTLNYLPKEKIAYVKGYSNTRAVRIDGKHVGNIPNEGMQGFKSINEPTFTLCAAGPLGLYDKNLQKVRDITIREALKIQGFPDEYQIPEDIKKTNAYKLVGNAVAPPIAYMIMNSISDFDHSQ